MKKINNVLIFFVAINALLFVGFWFFLQSELVGGILSRYINRVFLKAPGIELSFDYLSVGLFPPSTNLKNVKIHTKSMDSIFTLEANSIGSFFKVSDFFGDELSIDSIRVVDANLTGSLKKDQNGSKQKVVIKDIYRQARAIVNSEIPFKVSFIVANNINININENIASASKIKLAVKKDKFSLTAKATDIFIPSIRNGQLDMLNDFNASFSLVLSKEQIKIINLSARKKLIDIKLNGSFYNERDDSLKSDLIFESDSSLEQLTKITKLKNRLGEVSGKVETKIHAHGNLLNPELDFEVKFKNFKTDFLKGRFLNLAGNTKNDLLEVKKVFFKDKDSSLELLEKSPLYNIKSKEFLTNNFKFKVNNIYSNTAFFVIRDILDSFKSSMSGNLNVRWDKEKVIFSPEEGFSFNNVFVKTPSEDQDILSTKKLEVRSGKVLLHKNLDIDLDLKLKLKKSKLNVIGSINHSDLDIDIYKSKLYMDELGPIMGVTIGGFGPIDIKIKGKYKDDIKFIFKPLFSQFSLLDFHLKKAKISMEYSLEKSRLLIKKVNGSFLDTNYSGGGFVDFNKNNLNLDFDFSKLSYQNFLTIFKAIIPTEKWFPRTLRSQMKSKMNVSGKLDIKDLVVKGRLSALGTEIYGEGVDRILFDYSFQNLVVGFNNFKLKKGKGELKGKFLYDTKKSYFEYDFNLTNLKTDSIDLHRNLGIGIEGLCYGTANGNGTLKDYSSQVDLHLVNSSIDTIAISDSHLSMYNSDKDLYINGNFLGDSLVFNSYLNLLDKSLDKSYVNIHANIFNLREYLGIYSLHNMRNEDIKGAFKADFSSYFFLNDMRSLSANLIVENFDFKLEKFRLNFDRKSKGLRIDNGRVTEFNLLFSGNNGKLEIDGKGEISKKLDITHNFIVDAVLLKLLSPKIIDSRGVLSGRGGGFFSHDDYFGKLDLTGSNVELKAEDIPARFSKVGFDLSIDNKKMVLHDLNGEFGKGRLKGSGQLDFILPFPVLDFEFGISQSIIPLMDKSQLILSASGKLNGNKFPYVIDAQVSILEGEILDSVATIVKQYKEDDSYKQFIPKRDLKRDFELFNFDLDINIINPIIIKNRVADIKIMGDGSLNDHSGELAYKGGFYAKPFESKFLFKGNDFLLDEGLVDVDSSQSPKVNVDFIGVTSISDYEVKLKVDGASDNINIGFSSDPYLEQEDILSLLTLGVTSDISKKLKEREKQSVTTIGLGSLIMDQLRLNEGLSSSLGLKLSVLPEFSENEDSLLEGKSSVSNSSSGRVKSATKIRLQKKLSRKVDLSVSSTVGGSIDEKQEMNINYNINKALSLEGVYEVHSDDKDQNDKPESVGADFKYKWSF